MGSPREPEGEARRAAPAGCLMAEIKAQGRVIEARDRFPHGIRDVIELFGVMTDDAMKLRIDGEPGFARFRIRDKIAFAVRARLEYQAPYREAVRRLMTWYALPLHMKRGFKRMTKTVDAIWRAAGDTSTDYNYYTKRILLAAVLKSVTLYWLDDETPGAVRAGNFSTAVLPTSCGSAKALVC